MINLCINWNLCGSLSNVDNEEKNKQIKSPTTSYIIIMIDSVIVETRTTRKIVHSTMKSRMHELNGGTSNKIVGIGVKMNVFSQVENELHRSTINFRSYFRQYIYIMCIQTRHCSGQASHSKWIRWHPTYFLRNRSRTLSLWFDGSL